MHVHSSCRSPCMHLAHAKLRSRTSSLHPEPCHRSSISPKPDFIKLPLPSRMLPICSCSRNVATDKTFSSASSRSVPWIKSVSGSTPSLVSSSSTSSASSRQATPSLLPSSSFHSSDQANIECDPSELDLPHLNSLLGKLAHPPSFSPASTPESCTSHLVLSSTSSSSSSDRE